MTGPDISEEAVARPDISVEAITSLVSMMMAESYQPAHFGRSILLERRATTVATLRARVTELEAALATIIDGDVPRPIGEYWFPDHKPSKHDKCTHGVWMYEDCGNCIAEFAIRARSEGDA